MKQKWRDAGGRQISRKNQRSTNATSPRTRLPEYFSASRSGPVRSISRSTAWPSRRAEITGKDSGVLAGAIVGGAIASTAYGYYGGPYYPSYGYYPGYVGYGYYPGYVGYGPYYRSGPWPAMQEPGLARFYGPRGYGWGYW
jgi:hypothetical protein